MESKNRQPLKIMSNLKRISELDLKEKAKFMEGSIFHGLSKVYNKREQSATLIASFCKTYDATKKVFVLNNEISFGFCSSEVAMVLNLEDTGISFKDYVTHCSKYPKKFPDFLFKLRELYAEEKETDKNVGFTSKHLKDILKNMVVDDEESKLQFRRLMSYYLIEQVLLCTSSKKPQASWWKLVCDIDMFEKVNWSKATFDHLLESVNETKEWLERGGGSQHIFKGAAPVLEAIVYERIPSVQPKIFSVDPPLIQKYKSQRNDATSWAKIKLLMATDITICPHCATMANEDDGFSSHDDELVVLPCSLATEASSSQVAKEKKPTERADIVREDEEKATNLADNGRAGSFIDANGIYLMPQSLSLSRNSVLKDSFTHEMSGLGMPRESGPWGPAGGMPWDDGVFSYVKQVHVHMGECSKVICGIQFAYVKRDGKSILSQLHGGTHGDKTELVELDGGEEYLTGISGFYGSVKEFNGLEGITSITFHTNKKMYGPYGQRSGAGYVYFASTSSPGKVVGFKGRSGDFLTAIGVHMEYL